MDIFILRNAYFCNLKKDLKHRPGSTRDLKKVQQRVSDTCIKRDLKKGPLKRDP